MDASTARVVRECRGQVEDGRPTSPDPPPPPPHRPSSCAVDGRVGEARKRSRAPANSEQEAKLMGRKQNLLRGAHQRSERSFSGKRARKRNDRPTSFYSSRLQSTLSALDGRAAALCCRAAGRARHERTRSPAMRARPAPPRRSRRAVLHQGCAGLQGWPLEGPRRLRRCCKVCSLRSTSLLSSRTYCERA
jgi:hypothetical protein